MAVKGGDVLAPEQQQDIDMSRRKSVKQNIPQLGFEVPVCRYFLINHSSWGVGTECVFLLFFILRVFV